MTTSFPNSQYTWGLGKPPSPPGLIQEESGTFSHRVLNTVTRRGSRKSNAGELSNLAAVVDSLRRRNSLAMDSIISAKMMNTTHATIIDWIRAERMSKLPPEASSYDRVLVWASLFVDRLHSFDLEIQEFAGDSHLAAQLVYGYCALLLELGEENSSALMTLFGFFCNCSVHLTNLLDRAELFMVSSDIKDQLVLALGDLVTLVVSVATHFHKALRGLTSESVSIDIYSSFPGPIESFRSRCEHVSKLMWRHQLLHEGLEEESVSEVTSIKHWLQPEDPALASIPQTAAHPRQDREELTCVWMTPYLTRFFKNGPRTLTFIGKPGSGKTILSSVLIDYLQYPIGGVSYKSIYVPINSRVPVQTTPRSIVKSILSQLFDSRIGNVRLYQILADAWEDSQQAVKEADYDDILWTALDDALQASMRGPQKLVLVVDGMDEASCGESALVKRLHQATSNADNLKLILLGSEKPATVSKDQMFVNITPDLVFDDIAAVVRHFFQADKAFMALSEEQRETTINRIVEASDGSFLWAKLAAQRVRDEGYESVENLSKARSTLTDLVSHTLHTSTLDGDGKLILSWLVTAPRPLLPQELASLLSVQLNKVTVIEKDVDVRHLLKSVDSLVFFQNGLVYLRHDQIRTAIMTLLSQGKFFPEIKNRHVELLRRLLLYTKHYVTNPHEPSLTPLDPHTTTTLLDKHPLLDFSIRYWIDHAKTAFGCTTETEISTAVKDLRNLIPTCTIVPLLAMSVWEASAPPAKLSHYDIQTRIYRQLLTPTHQTTLQAIICQALFYRNLQDNLPSRAALVLYDAVRVSNDLLSPRHAVTMQMCRYFLDATVGQVTDTKTEIMMKRVEVLQVLVECCKLHYSATSEIVISVMTQLAEHYHSINEDKKAQEIYASLQESTSTSTTTTTQWAGSRKTDDSLCVNIRGYQTKDTTEVGTVLLLDETEEDARISTASTTTIESLLDQAERYISSGQLKLAESAYVEAWQRTSKEYRLNRSAEWELKKIRAVLAYAKFLKSQKRDDEAASILVGFWQEYEQSSRSSSETVVSQFTEVAKSMKAVGLLSTALGVFKHCAQYYERSTSGRTSGVYKEIQQEIQTTSKQVMQIAKTTTTASAVTESSLKEMVVYDSSMDQTSMDATNTLVQMYMSQRRWHDATTLIKKVLRAIWPALFAVSIQEVVLPSRLVDFCVSLAERSSECYHARRLLAKEEDLRHRLYHAVRRDRSPGDALLDRITTGLLRLYQRTNQPDKVIQLHQEMLRDATKHYGSEHPTVLKKLWTLAELTSPRQISVDYYCQIVQILNKKDPETCHPDAFEPLVIVVNDLWNKERYSDALQPLRVLFNTLKMNPSISPKLHNQEFVQMLFQRYTHCLRLARANSTILHDVATVYRNSCKSMFGATASITIQATLALANICQESSQYESEAVTLYESLLQTKSDQIDHEEIQATLDAIHEKDTAGTIHTKTESLTTQQLQKVITTTNKRMSFLRSSYGWAHEESLSWMEEMASLYAQRGELATLSSMLKDDTLHILSTETSSSRLAAAAKSIASCYILSGQIQRGRELSQEIYRQMVAKVTAQQHRISLLFLAQLEYSLREDSSLTLNEIFSSLTTESLYWDHFRSEIRSKTSTIESVTLSAARLYASLQLTHSHQLSTLTTSLLNQFTDFFMTREGEKLGSIDSTCVQAFLHTIVEYFSTHSSQDFLRSVAIASYHRVCELLSQRQYQSACDMARTSFTYIRSQDGYSNQAAMAKLAFQLGMAISGRDLDSRPDETRRKRMLEISFFIMKETIRLFKRMKIDLASLGQENLNLLIGLLDEQQDYTSLAWVLTTLWDTRETRGSAQPYFILTLARMLIITRYLVGDCTAALRLAEDIVYNCARVHGVRHPNTFEMTVLLSQLYTSVAQRSQSQTSAQRYYKKAAALHENALRAFLDPSSLEIEYSAESDAGSTTPSEALEDQGEHVRQHLHLLKLAVERLGGWPKDYGEYERLNADLFAAYPEDLKGVEGVEKWNLKSFGSGRAESSDDMVSSHVRVGGLVAAV